MCLRESIGKTVDDALFSTFLQFSNTLMSSFSTLSDYKTQDFIMKQTVVHIEGKE